MSIWEFLAVCAGIVLGRWCFELTKEGVKKLWRRRKQTKKDVTP